ncbi:MAG: NAD(P)H-dependent oxidoreductase subunit E, partial [Gammaproteobacteria bacterium]
MSNSNKRIKGLQRGRPLDDVALAEIRSLLGEDIRRRDLLIEYLHRIQDRFGCISDSHCVALADELDLSSTEVYEVATFYHHFDIVKDDKQRPPAITVRVCQSISCALFGAADLLDSLRDSLEPAVRVQPVPCVGRCNTAPAAVVGSNPIAAASIESVSAAVNAKALQAPSTQHLSYEEYCRDGGYDLLRECHRGARKPDDVVEALQNSNLRGLGGAGFPAGTKWSILRDQPAPRLIAVNIDEGEPGTFKDRIYLERDPHRFIEGMLIAAWAIEATGCYIYIRDEYTGCRRALEKELQ